jgi:hypothetical protein
MLRKADFVAIAKSRWALNLLPVDRGAILRGDVV